MCIFILSGEDVGPDALAEWAKRFGLGKTTGIDLPSGRPGFIPTPAWKRKVASDPANKIWYPGETANMSIGQGDLQVTPIQLANYTAALANGGTLWRPHLVRAIVDTSGPKPTVTQTIAPEARGELGLKPENLNLIVAGMRKTMQKGGTAFASAIPGLDIAGKTGTVEIKKQRNSVFVCFAGLPGAKAEYRACGSRRGRRLRFRNRRAHRPPPAGAIFPYSHQSRRNRRQRAGLNR